MGVTVIGGGTAATGGDQVGDLVQLPTNALYYKNGDKEYLRRGAYLDNDGTSYPEAISSGLTTAENLWWLNVETDSVVYTPYDGGYVVITQDSGSSYPIVYKTTSFSTAPSSANFSERYFEPHTIATPGTTGSTIVVGGGYYSATLYDQVYYSTDGGGNWTATNIPPDNKNWCVACNDSGTLWLAVSGLLADGFYVSTDGQSYTANTPSVADASSIKSITWNESGGYFVIGSGAQIYKTTDGITLTDITPLTLGNLNDFIAVTSDGTIYVYCPTTSTSSRNAILKSSNDGSSWTDVSPQKHWAYLDANETKYQYDLVNMSVDGNRLTIGISLLSSAQDSGAFINGHQFLYTDDAGSTWENIDVDPFAYTETYGQVLTNFFAQAYKGPNLFITRQDRGSSIFNGFTLTKDPHNDTLIGLPSGTGTYTQNTTYGRDIYTDGFGFIRIK